MAESIPSYVSIRLRSVRRLTLAFSITFLIFVAELFGGIISNRLSLLGDAGQMVLDSLALAVGIIAFKLTQRPATKSRTFGYHRLEIIAALFNGVLLILVALYLFVKAYHRLTMHPEIKAPLMLIFATVGLCANFLSLNAL